jgi:hypothetical protein
VRKLRRVLGRVANRVLKPLRLELAILTNDFDARLVSQRHLDRMFREIGRISGQWLSGQDFVRRAFDTEIEVRDFFADYLRSPFRGQHGGSRFGNLLWLNLLAKAQNPDVIVDSGTFKGASAWSLARGAPEARIRSYDLDLSQLICRVSRVEYLEHDWFSDDPTKLEGDVRLFYFDDHIDQGRRLIEAVERDCDLAVFDDDFSLLSFVTMAHGGAALPKISFILDDALEDGELIEWIVGGKQYAWRVNRRDLDRLRSLIANTDRLPDISALVGIGQLPYRVVALKPRPTDDAKGPSNNCVGIR